MERPLLANVAGIDHSDNKYARFISPRHEGFLFPYPHTTRRILIGLAALNYSQSEWVRPAFRRPFCDISSYSDLVPTQHMTGPVKWRIMAALRRPAVDKNHRIRISFRFSLQPGVADRPESKNSSSRFPRGQAMGSKKNQAERLVAILLPWEKLPTLAKRRFRIESLPAEKKVMVWRDDLQGEAELAAELSRAGVAAVELRQQIITDWRAVD
jgi:hypothetical protein